MKNYYTNGIWDSYIYPYIFPTGIMEAIACTNSRIRTIKTFRHSKRYGEFQDMEAIEDSIVQGESVRN
jgi:hypothetical protein